MTLRSKIVIWSSLSVLAVFGVIGTAGLEIGRRRAEREMLGLAGTAVDQVVATVATLGEAGDMETLRQYLARVRALPQVAAVTTRRAASVAAEYGEGIADGPADADQRLALEQGRPVSRWEDRRLRRVTPIRAAAGCLECHQAREGDVLGVADVTLDLASVVQARAEQRRLLLLAILLSAAVNGLVLRWLVGRQVIRRLTELARTVLAHARHLQHSADNFAAAAGSLAEGASVQAGTLQQTVAAIQEITARNRENNEHAQRAAQQIRTAAAAARRGQEVVAALRSAVTGIQEASQQTRQIIASIDEITFQTNLLALNASVEAARAGEAGRGFAVVADEVRRLAAESAEAAHRTRELLETAMVQAEAGVSAGGEVDGVIGEIDRSVETTAALIEEVSQATNVQQQDVSRVTMAMEKIEDITRSNAASAEQSASASQELADVAREMERTAASLLASVVGESAEGVS